MRLGDALKAAGSSLRRSSGDPGAPRKGGAAPDGPGNRGGGASPESSSATAKEKTARSAAPLRKIAVSPTEAAEALGISRDSFDRHVKPELRLVYRGRLVLVPVKELDDWLEKNAKKLN